MCCTFEDAELTRLQARVALPGKFNMQASVARCRRSCAVARSCNAWVFCWERGGCDDGRDIRPDMYPLQVATWILIQ